MSEIKVVGLDLSITCTGYARTDGTTGTVPTKTNDRDQRLIIIREALRPVVEDAHAAVLEDATSGLRGAAMLAVHHLQGVVRALLMDLGVPYAVVPPNTLKKYATGDGGASKTDMAMAAFKRAGIEFEKDKGGDQCDAWWLRCAGLEHWEPGSVPAVLPAAQRAALGVVKWPETNGEILARSLSAVFDPWA